MALKPSSHPDPAQSPGKEEKKGKGSGRVLVTAPGEDQPHWTQPGKKEKEPEEEEKREEEEMLLATCSWFGA